MRPPPKPKLTCGVIGHVLSPEAFGYGRFVCLSNFLEVDYDCAQQVITFVAPSASRPGTRVYGLELAVGTGEIACACERVPNFVMARKNKRDIGTYAEVLAAQNGLYLKPLITRMAENLCPHQRAAQRWVKRHRLFDLFLERERRLIEDIVRYSESMKTYNETRRTQYDN